ncbi:hypothetical protein A33M_2895 [Rhodovulum sp. PH10]|uniref:SPOR domain-containing protein n=1 Tax=Rhodovulum sp. PH10 TaxID=1187851 RepID=UPI00027C2A57|nr:SPOR domain-containing protein [Rhodovulum sp. PH10]EJW11698.1 hypothetical protein A33M_2895 [Rhodovulum sp. PH10]
MADRLANRPTNRPQARQTKDDRRIEVGPLFRLAGWGLAAVAAVGLAVLAGRSEVGERRLAMASGPLAARADAMKIATAQAMTQAIETERETRRLAESLKSLEGDRDTLAGRLAAVEASLADLTGSIALTRPLAHPPAGTDRLLDPGITSPVPTPPDGLGTPATSRPTAESENPAAPIELHEPARLATAGSTAALGLAAQETSTVPLPRPKPVAVAARTPAPSSAQPAPPAAPAAATPVAATSAAAVPPPARNALPKRYGIQIGGTGSLENLRTMWGQVKAAHPAVVAGLEPAVALHQTSKPGVIETRLVAGPVSSTIAATRLCATLAASGVACRATLLDGRTLALP